MIVQCPGCKELVQLESFQAEAATLRFSCPACRQEQLIRSRITSQNRPLFPEPEPGRSSPPPTPAALPPPTTPAAPPSITAPPSAPVEDGPQAHLWQAWNKLTTGWAQPSAHESFVTYCATSGALPFAGQRYRDHLTQHPDDPLAKKGRDRVLAQAMAMAQSTRDDAPKTSALAGNAKLLVNAGLVLVILVLGFAMVNMMASSMTVDP